MPRLSVIKIGPAATIQDLGRPGWRAQGLSVGGAADPMALLEGAAVLGSSPENAAIEMMGMGGVFRCDAGVRFCLTGAKVAADVDGVAVARNAGCFLHAGATLTIGAAGKGVYSYLILAGGINTPCIMQSRATHLTAGIGRTLRPDDTLPIGPDRDRAYPPQKLTVPNRLEGGTVRVMPGPQTDLFSKEVIERFMETTFRRNPRANRQGVRLDYDGPLMTTAGSLNLVSDLIVPGDIQMTGEGVPYVLMAECQTIGGYPRVGTVIPADLPMIAQAPSGAPLRFTFLTTPEADATATTIADTIAQLRKQCQPMVRDPNDIADLLRYQLISGATRGDDLERQTDDPQN